MVEGGRQGCNERGARNGMPYAKRCTRSVKGRSATKGCGNHTANARRYAALRGSTLSAARNKEEERGAAGVGGYENA